MSRVEVENDLIRETTEQIIVAEDKEIHVSVVSTEDGPTFVEIRTFIPSTNRYGHGILLPPGVTLMIHDALAVLLRDGLVS